MLAGCVKEKHACVIREVRTLAKVSIVITPKKHVARNNFYPTWPRATNIGNATSKF